MNISFLLTVNNVYFTILPSSPYQRKRNKNCFEEEYSRRPKQGRMLIISPALLEQFSPSSSDSRKRLLCINDKSHVALKSESQVLAAKRPDEEETKPRQTQLSGYLRIIINKSHSSISSPSCTSANSFISFETFNSGH
jgi:hypothetical protein